jgi:hypothetical protein
VIQLQILTGRFAGREIIVGRFPFLIGRAGDAGLRLEDPGVWEHHMRLDFSRREGFEFSSEGAALTLVNGTQTISGVLRNGDMIELGAAQIRFWLAPPAQQSLRWREALTWTTLFALLISQLGLIWLLLR